MIATSLRSANVKYIVFLPRRKWHGLFEIDCRINFCFPYSTLKFIFVFSRKNIVQKIKVAHVSRFCGDKKHLHGKCLSFVIISRVRFDRLIQSTETSEDGKVKLRSVGSTPRKYVGECRIYVGDGQFSKSRKVLVFEWTKLGGWRCGGLIFRFCIR